MESKRNIRQEFINKFRHAIDAKTSFADMVNGKISKKEFEARGPDFSEIIFTKG